MICGSDIICAVVQPQQLHPLLKIGSGLSLVKCEAQLPCSG